MIERISEKHESMRGYFAYELHNQMRSNKDIWVVTADLGYGMFDRIRRDFPKRFINTGAAEQTAIGLSVGLAEEGKIPFVYSITPFLLYRPFETIRNYINHEQVPVKLVGGGRNRDYEHDGFSHWSEEDRDIMRVLKNIHALWPSKKEDMEEVVRWAVNNQKPTYINLTR